MNRAATGIGLAVLVSAGATIIWMSSDVDPLSGARSGSRPETTLDEFGSARSRSARTEASEPRTAAPLTGSTSDEDAVSAGRTTIEAVDPAPATTPAQAAGNAHVAGWLGEREGFGLAAHTIEITSERAVPSGHPESVLEGTAITDATGAFRIDALQPGMKTLRVLGPGDGDKWDWKSDMASSPDGQYALEPDERHVQLMVPEAGVSHLSLLSEDHDDILVTARIVDDRLAPIAWAGFDFDQDTDDHPDVQSDENGLFATLITVREDSVFELSQDDDFLRDFREWTAEQEGEAPPGPRRYLSVAIQLRATPMRQDLGTLVMPRVAGLAVTLTDASNHQGIGGASVRLQCTGGDRPPTDERGRMQRDGTYVVWSGRQSGGYVLDVTASGYKPAHQVGVLMAGDGPVPLELILERNR